MITISNFWINNKSKNNKVFILSFSEPDGLPQRLFANCHKKKSGIKKKGEKNWSAVVGLFFIAINFGGKSFKIFWTFLENLVYFLVFLKYSSWRWKKKTTKKENVKEWKYDKKTSNRGKKINLFTKGGKF